jgi:2-dehydropantoate 2-reductase
VKIAVVGAGAIGGYLGGWLGAAGEDVTFVARGRNLDAIRENGMRVIGEDGKETVAKGRTVERMNEAGRQDLVLLTVKAHQVAAVAGDMHTMLGDDTTIVTMQNGIPWWYFYCHGGEHDGRPVRAADPQGEIGRAVDPKRIVGSVVYPAAVLEQPGVVRVIEGRRFALGEPDGSESRRAKAISQVLTRAGFKAPVIKDIRAEIWLKLWGNMSFNPISALTHATLVDLLQFPLTRELCIEMMREAEAVANKLGITFRVGIDKRIAGAQQVGAHKTSMLQDVESGKEMEIEALVGSVVELGRLTDTPTPQLDAVYACVSLLGHTLAKNKGKLSLGSK